MNSPFQFKYFLVFSLRGELQLFQLLLLLTGGKVQVDSFLFALSQDFTEMTDGLFLFEGALGFLFGQFSGRLMHVAQNVLKL